MAKNFQSNERKKNANSKDDFKRGKESIRDKIEGERLENLKDWITFYRRNIHHFVEHYMGVKLFPYQRYWIYIIATSTSFLGYASRASAKSWLIGVYAIARCILYPSTIVSLNSSTKGQAGLIISEKIQALHDEHPNISREISNITTNANKWRVDFHNGSKINVVISGEGGRGHRSNVSVLEERRLIPSVIIDAIIRPFLVARIAPYMGLDEYKDLPAEEPQEIIISSVHYKSGEWYPEAKKRLKRIVDGDPDIKGIFLDYLITLKHNIKTKKQMKKEQDDIDPITFSMEYGNIPFGGSSSAFYKMEFFKRTLKRAWLPRRLGVDGIGKNKYDIPRKTGERRVVAIDVAARAGSRNDNTIIICARLMPTHKGWKTDIVYIESHNGENTVKQALRIKQIYQEFSGYSPKDGYHPDDAIILDVANVGIGVYDTLTQVTADEERDVEYDAMTVMDRHEGLDEGVQEELAERCLTPDAYPCIFPISGTSVLNSTIASSLRTRLKSGLLNFLIDINQQEEFWIKKKNKDITRHEDIPLRAYILSPNAQTTQMVNECISLEMKETDGQLVKLAETGAARKDRYSALSYLNYFCSLIDPEILKDEKDADALSVFSDAFAVV